MCCDMFRRQERRRVEMAWNGHLGAYGGLHGARLQKEEESENVSRRHHSKKWCSSMLPTS